MEQTQQEPSAAQGKSQRPKDLVGYEASLAYLKQLTQFGINLGLDRIQNLLGRLGNPQEGLRIIHIGGTNGKGSTTAILQAILREAGYRVGTFISPHLLDYRERIQIDGVMISPQAVVDGIAKMEPLFEAMVAQGVEHPTEFEVSTALALDYFSLHKPDFVLLEVGLGGAIDSTNVVTPLLSVLTSIGMDHMEYLGHTLEEIAHVKAGIIKPGVTLVSGTDKESARRVLEARVAAQKSPMVQAGEHFTWTKGGLKGNLQSFDYLGLHQRLSSLDLSLLGDHQLSNASVALAVCEVLEHKHQAVIPEQAIRQGLRKAWWPARQELLCQRPKVLLDGAHNVDGMLSLRQSLLEYQTGIYQREKLILCIGMLDDKEVERAMEIIAPLADRIIVTKPDSPRARGWADLASLAQRYLPRENILAIENPIEAVQTALSNLRPEDMLCVTGSLYMLGQVREYLIRTKRY